MQLGFVSGAAGVANVMSVCVLCYAGWLRVCNLPLEGGAGQTVMIMAHTFPLRHMIGTLHNSTGYLQVFRLAKDPAQRITH